MWRAKLTGLETEGDLIGEVVCPIINLWGIKGKKRTVPVAKLPHGTEVYVEKTTKGPEGKLLRVRSIENPKVRGWVTERFVCRI